ncbi:MAG TPA: phosphoribosyltransferase family protein [Planctomycetota bacterium]|nr:phosphoribosyltransferase family protein [Planctomycetota bacterium]
MPARARGLPRGLAPLISQAQIYRRLSAMARAIPRRIPVRERPIAIVVLQGAFIFAADLLRRLPSTYDIDVAFLRCQSYGSGTKSSGRVMLLQDIDSEIDLRGRTVLLIDDILDSGLTLKFLTDHLKRRGAKRIRVCVLLHRNPGSNASGIVPDLAGFPVRSEFVVGYGLDYAGRYRHLPGLAALVRHAHSGKKQ